MLPALLLGLFFLSGSLGRADDRGTVVLSYTCSGELGKRDITLFANGTVRLREGLWEKREMYLDELGPEALASKLRLLEEVHAAGENDQFKQPVADGPGGRWVEKCEVYLALPDERPFTHRFSRYDVPPLRVSRLIHIAEELAEYTRPPEGVERLPTDYEPRVGDILRTVEGKRFKVIRYTVDERGIELRGLEEPLSIFVALTEIGEAFVALEPSDRP
ncbi:MAG: hypothetical protein GY856_27385 [bacterium]|nr:hypothetical protein [bacterium]